MGGQNNQFIHPITTCRTNLEINTHRVHPLLLLKTDKYIIVSFDTGFYYYFRIVYLASSRHETICAVNTVYLRTELANILNKPFGHFVIKEKVSRLWTNKC